MSEQSGGGERQLLSEARAGSSTAMGQVLEACRRYLLAIANRQMGRDLQAKAGASDLIQQTFLEAQRDFIHFSGSTTEELKAWLRRMLLNNVANFAWQFKETGKREIGKEIAIAADSSASVNIAFQHPSPDPSPSSMAVSNERMSAVLGAIGNLPEEYRQVIRYRYEQDLGFDEIARLMTRSENAVRKLWFRAVRQLREELEK